MFLIAAKLEVKGIYNSKIEHELELTIQDDLYGLL